MKETPKFIKEFSKDNFPEERKKTAQKIRSKRAEYFSEEHEKRSHAEDQAELQKTIDEREKDLAEKLKTIKNLEDKIAELSSSMLGKIKNYFKLKKVRDDIVTKEEFYNELKQAQEEELSKDKDISEKLKSWEVNFPLNETEEILTNFYNEQEEKWTESEYTKEDIEKNFSEENLASLSLEEYSLLLKRFPKEMVTHVTRQGVRDHIGHMYHTAGEGEYSDNFMKLIKDGRLRSALGIHLAEKEKEKAIENFLKLDNFKTKEEALNYLATLKGENPGFCAGYVDYMAVHFTTEEVADLYYGSEKGNEIFITYPSAYIASQYYFAGQLNKADGGYWNDQWVWANEEKGMDLNAGIVFIPEQAKVDRKTGSRYELDKDGNPVKNTKFKNDIQKLINSPNFEDFFNSVSKFSSQFSFDDFGTANKEVIKQKMFEKFKPFREKLEKEFGITNQRLQLSILEFDWDKLKSPNCSVESVIEDALKSEGVLYKEAENPISSKEFWEDYFRKNPEKKPSKIVYYKGECPTNALKNWQKEAGHEKSSEDEFIGFPERSVTLKSEQARSGLDRFSAIAKKVIDDYFSKQ